MTQRSDQMLAVYERDRGRMFTHERLTYTADGFEFVYQSGGNHRDGTAWWRVVCEGVVLKRSANAPDP